MGLLQLFPHGQALNIFVICLVIGIIVIIAYSLNQFPKPIAAPDDDSVPWNFVMPSQLTPPGRYLIGFVTYCCTMLLIFIVVSLVIGPARFVYILQTLTDLMAGKDPPDFTSFINSGLDDHPTFPLVIAFCIAGISTIIPKSVDFELPVRKFAYRIAYIPKHMHRIFYYMRFSRFDLPDEKVEHAYATAELRRPSNVAEVQVLLPVLDRAVVLYAEAATLGGDLIWQAADELAPHLDVETLKQYIKQIRNVGLNLQGIDSRLFGLADLIPGERARAIQAIQRDLNSSLDVLYVIFACASTARDIHNIADRLRAIGFSSQFPPPPAIPWDPILKVIGAAAMVLFVGYEIAADVPLREPVRSIFPTTTPDIIYLLFNIILVHTAAIALSLYLRATLMASDRYFAAGGANLLAYAKIFLFCFVVSLVAYLLLNSPNLMRSLVPSDGNAPLTLTQAAPSYFHTYLLWSLVPASCGAMSAYTVDRSADTVAQRALSGLLMGGTMGVIAVVAAQMLLPDWHSRPAPSSAIIGANFWLQFYNFVVYGGLGGIIGFSLPAALRRYWQALEQQLPEQISMLRANVLQYFRDIQQFNEWLNTTNAGLDMHRPLDLLVEDGGLNRLTAFAKATRRRI